MWRVERLVYHDVIPDPMGASALCGKLGVVKITPSRISDHQSWEYNEIVVLSVRQIAKQYTTLWFVVCTAYQNE